MKRHYQIPDLKVIDAMKYGEPIANGKFPSTIDFPIVTGAKQEIDSDGVWDESEE